jgi:hypothetical protein
LFLQAERLLEEELRGYGVEARADRLTSSQLRAAKSAIKANRKQHPKVQFMQRKASKEGNKETTSRVFYLNFFF